MLLSTCPNCHERTLNPVRVAFLTTPIRCANCNALLTSHVSLLRRAIMMSPILAFILGQRFIPGLHDAATSSLLGYVVVVAATTLVLMICLSKVRVVNPPKTEARA